MYFPIDLLHLFNLVICTGMYPALLNSDLVAVLC